MNPRTFCNEKDDSAVFIALTYNFDPLFFERVVLSNLEAAPIPNIFILADHNYIDENLFQKSDQIRYLGKKYILEKSSCNGLFHPKLMIKFSGKSAKIWVGSGNISSGGWGKNQELATQLDLSNNNQIFRKILNYTKENCDGILKNSIKNYLIDYEYGTEDTPNYDIEFSNKSNSLSAILADRWMGNKYNKLTIFTGSTDENAAFLSWANKTFEIEEFVVVSSKKNISFKKSQVASLPFKIKIAEIESDQIMHAKFYLFEGNSNKSLVVGSPNCSKIAWLIPPESGGNIESILIYDDIGKMDISNVLEKIPKELIPIKNRKENIIKDGIEEKPTTTKIRLERIDYDFEDSVIFVYLKSFEEIEFVKIDDEGKVYPLEYNKENRCFWAPIRLESKKNTTHFLEVLCYFKNGTIEKINSWVNNLQELEEYRSKRRIIRSIGNFKYPENEREQNRILHDIEIIAKSLFSDQDYDYDRKISNLKSNQKEKETPEIDPSKLVFSLKKFYTSDKIEEQYSGYYSYSIFGFLSDIFNKYNKKDELDVEGEIHIDTVIDGADTEDEQSISEKIATENFEIDTEKVVKKISDKIDYILDEIVNKNFYEKCSIGYFLHVISFPLAIIIQGINHGWLSPENCLDWYIRIVNILFTKIIEGHSGLINLIKHRYGVEKRTEVFDNAIGDGSLWVVLLSCIEKFEWKNKFDKILVMDEIFSNKNLVVNAKPEKVAYLISAHQFDTTKKEIFEFAEKSEIKKHIVSVIEEFYDDILEEQLGGVHQLGDYLYLKEYGWVKTLEEEIISSNLKINVYKTFRGEEGKVVSGGYYVNLRLAMQTYPKLNKMLRKLIN